MKNEEITDLIIAAAIEVHRNLGPGLLESVYVGCHAEEMRTMGLQVEREVEVPIVYKGKLINNSLKIDLFVNKLVMVEAKAIELILPVHKAQLLTYLRLSGCKVGLLLNFNVPLLKDGITRIANGY